MVTELNNIYIGLVVNNKDPKKRGRVQVFIPHISNTLYAGWNEENKDIKFRTLDSSVFTSEITQRLIDNLPWADVAMPFFGGGTGAPIDTSTNEPRPIPTGRYLTPFSSPLDYKVNSSTDTSVGNIPQKNIKDETVNVENLNPKIKADLIEFTKIFPDAVITSGAEGKPGDGIHGPNSEHYAVNNSDGKGGAFDLRNIVSRDSKGNPIYLDAETQQKYVEFFASKGYQGIGYEKDHLHIQLPPLKGTYKTFGPDGTYGSINQSAPSWFREFSAKMETGEYEISIGKKPEPPKQNGLNNKSAIVSSEKSGFKSSKSDDEVSEILKGQRQGFVDELKNENTKKIFYAIIEAEVGSYPDEDKIMLIESVMNRTYARKSEGNTLTSRGYYGPNTQTKIDETINGSFTLSKDKIEKYDQLVNRVINNGSNLSNFATGNNQNSPKDKTGYAGGPEVAVGIGERFGIEGNELDKKWARDLGVPYDSLEPYDGKKEGVLVARPNGDLNGESFNGVSGVGNQGSTIGMLSTPHVGAKAYVMFLDGNHLRPIVIGCYKETSNG